MHPGLVHAPVGPPVFSVRSIYTGHCYGTQGENLVVYRMVGVEGCSGPTLHFLLQWRVCMKSRPSFGGCDFFLPKILIRSRLGVSVHSSESAGCLHEAHVSLQFGTFHCRENDRQSKTMKCMLQGVKRQVLNNCSTRIFVDLSNRVPVIRSSSSLTGSNIAHNLSFSTRYFEFV